MKKKFIIPVMWQMYGLKEVEAETLEEAKKIAIEGSLPEGDYVDESFELEEESIIDEMNQDPQDAEQQ